MRLAALLFVVVACGGGDKHVNKPPPPPPDPIAKTKGPSCKAVTQHLATLADRDAAQDAKPDETLRARCEADAWSDDARTCFATAQAESELDGCKGMLTTGQQQAFQKAPEAASDDSERAEGQYKMKKAPPDPPPPHTRGPVKKGSSKAGNPDDGGE